MATYNDMLQANNPTLQVYSDAARQAGLQGNIRRAERRAAGRTALLTRGQTRAGGVPLDLRGQPRLATAAQINPSAVSKGEIEKSYAPMKSVYEFGKTSIGRIRKKMRDRTTFLGLQEGAKLGDEGFANLAKGISYGGSTGRGGTDSRRRSEANNLIREYRAYVKKYNEDKAAALARV
jgi:hypothetical protein